MPLSDKMIKSADNTIEHTVYFYPNAIKIGYSSLEDLKEYLKLLFSRNIKLENKLKEVEVFFRKIMSELYSKGIQREDQTMVIYDRIADREVFLEAVKKAYSKTIELNISSIKLTGLQITRRQILVALFMQKTSPVKDFFNIIKGKGIFYSQILNSNIDLEKHSAIKFRATEELEDYIVNILTRKALLSQGGAVYTLRKYLSIIIELVIWYSRSLSLLENSDEVNSSILSTSIKLVDNYYITNPSFIRMLQGNLMGNIMKLLS